MLRGRYEIVYLTAPLILLAFLFANHFNIVGMGKDFSRNLGVPYNLVLFMGLTIAAMITASIVVVVGSISYIGPVSYTHLDVYKRQELSTSISHRSLKMPFSTSTSYTVMPFAFPV